MNIVKFTLPDGGTDCYINLDAVVAAKPAEDGKVNIHTNNLSIVVDARQFENAINSTSETSALTSVLKRLIEAMDRMTVHFPTSIRMHL